MPSSALQEIVALLGCPAAGNPAQYLFERAIAAASLDWQFISCDVAAADASAALAGVIAMGFRGCLLSGPLRDEAFPLMTSASPSASFARSVSLIERRDDGFVGHMTDGRGIVEAVRGHVDPAQREAVVLGADACGRATALELALAGVTTIHVADPDAAQAHALVEALGSLPNVASLVMEWQPDMPLPEGAAIVIISPAGCRGTLAGLRADLVVADASLAETVAVASARTAGACIIDGLEIRAVQTAIDFHTLSGLDVDVDMLRDALEEFLS